MKLPVPTSRREVILSFTLSPPVFAVVGAGVSLMYSYATMAPEALKQLQAEVFQLAGWMALICAATGLLFAWLLYLRYRALAPELRSESDRLKAWVETPEGEAVSEEPGEPAMGG